MNRPLMDLFRQSGDAHLGQTLVRLAKLAQAAHQYEQAQAIGQADIAWPQAGRPAHGRAADRPAAAIQDATAHPSARTEAR